MKKTPKVSIAIINYNSKDLLAGCIEALRKSTYPHVEIILIDQNSADGSANFVEKYFSDVRIVRNQNTGYAGGANKAYEVTNGNYIVVMNPDVTVTKDYIGMLVEACENDKKIGAITGKILKPQPEQSEGFSLPTASTRREPPIIDTTGLLIFKNRRVVDRGQGSVDKGQFDRREEVFGISGCLAFYRREALEAQTETKGSRSQGRLSEAELYNKEVWDNDFFMYKEDIDVSWRLNLRGWKCIYEPRAIAYHARETKILRRYTDRDVIEHRKSVSPLARYYSYKNQRLMQVKNEISADVLRDLPLLILRELFVFGYILLREPRTLKAVFYFLWQLPRALKKRRYIQNHHKMKTMKRFINGHPKDTCLT